MGVDVSHLVLEALGDTGDQVGDERFDGTEGGNIFTVAVVDLDRDGVLLGVTEVDSQVTEVLDELAYNPSMLEFPSSCHVVESAVQEIVLTSDWWVVFRTSGTLNSDDTGLDADLDYSQKKIQCQLHDLRKRAFRILLSIIPSSPIALVDSPSPNAHLQETV
jgi:hypothetical protein